MKGDSVDIRPRGNGFIVRLTEDGEVTEKEFVLEAFARSFATGQSVRLKVSAEIVERRSTLSAARNSADAINPVKRTDLAQDAQERRSVHSSAPSSGLLRNDSWSEKR
jgi:predicted acyl esterase